MYLPKTWPSHPTPSRELAFFSPSGSTMYKTVTLRPVWPTDVSAKIKATCPIVELSYPSGASYSSGRSIPLKLSIQSTEAPALAQLIQGFEAQLVKQIMARSSSGQVVGGREVVVSKGDSNETDTTKEGFAVSYVDLTLGELGKEQSWGITEVVEVAYLIRVSVSCSLSFVPTYKHVLGIEVTTEPWGTRERGLLAFGGFSDPAIGMGDERLQSRRPSTVRW